MSPSNPQRAENVEEESKNTGQSIPVSNNSYLSNFWLAQNKLDEISELKELEENQSKSDSF